MYDRYGKEGLRNPSLLTVGDPSLLESVIADRYRDLGDVSIDGLATRLRSDFGEKPLDILIHSLANGPEVNKPLIETSRRGYLAAVGVSAYSLTSMVARLLDLGGAGRRRPGCARVHADSD